MAMLNNQRVYTIYNYIPGNMYLFFFGVNSHMLHGAGIVTYTWAMIARLVGTYSSIMKHMGYILQLINKILDKYG